MLEAQTGTVGATVNYIARSDEQLCNYYYMEPPPGKPASNEVLEPHEIAIADMRELRRPPSLDVEGFALAGFSTEVTDIYDAAQVETVYAREIEELIKRVTGAQVVRARYPFLRGEEAQRRFPGTITAPAPTTHVDYTVDTGPEWFDIFLGEEADQWRGRPYALINAWRAITGPLRDRPLAVCDARTVPLDDLMTSLSISLIDENGLHSETGTEVEESAIYSVAWNPDHRWYYASDMMPDEMLLMKNYDSRSDVARFAPHVSFEHPGMKDGDPPRASVELRALTVF